MVRKEGNFDYFLVIRRNGRGLHFILNGRTTMVKEPPRAYKVRRIVGGFSHKILKGRLVYMVRGIDIRKALKKLSSKDEVTLRIVKTTQFRNHNNAYDKAIRNTLNYLYTR